MTYFQRNYCRTHEVDFINYSALSPRLREKEQILDNSIATVEVACSL